MTSQPQREGAMSHLQMFGHRKMRNRAMRKEILRLGVLLNQYEGTAFPWAPIKRYLQYISRSCRQWLAVRLHCQAIAPK